MILALDVGNGSIKYARFDGGRRVDAGRLPLDATPDAAECSTIAAVSVNPPVLARLRNQLPDLRVVGKEIDAGLAHYATCGPDRVMGVLGALHLRPEAAAVLLLDSGTCLTATLGIRGTGVVGGAIAPGIDLMARSLADGTQTLPLVQTVDPQTALGRSTEEAIQAGVWAAFVGAAGELVRGIAAQRPEGFDVVAAGTGGAALAAAVAQIDAVHPHATLWGVYVAATA